MVYKGDKQYKDAYRFWVSFVNQEKFDLQRSRSDVNVKQILQVDLHNHMKVLEKMSKDKNTQHKDLVSKTAMVNAYRQILNKL